MFRTDGPSGVRLPRTSAFCVAASCGIAAWNEGFLAVNSGAFEGVAHDGNWNRLLFHIVVISVVAVGILVNHCTKDHSTREVVGGGVKN